MVRRMSRRLSRRPEQGEGEGVQAHEGSGSVVPEETKKETEMERQARVMGTRPEGIYERFRRGLLEYHSEVSCGRWCD